jgi:hypothetical protein
MVEITIWSETKKGGKVVERFDTSTTNIDLSDRRIATTDLSVLDQFPNLEGSATTRGVHRSHASRSLLQQAQVSGARTIG